MRRKLERRWRMTKSFHDYNAYILQCRCVQQLISSSKSDYYTSIIDENRTNQKALFKVVDHLLNRKEAPKLPALPPNDLPDYFASFFIDKIANIRRSLSTHCNVDYPAIPAASALPNMVEFNYVTSFEIEKLIKSSSTKSCVSDPLPTWFLRSACQYCYQLSLTS